MDYVNWGDDRYSLVACMLREGRFAEIPEFMVNNFTSMDCINCDYLSSRLKSIGCFILGAGAYSIVFTVPGIDGAVKMTYNRRDKWAEYAKFAMEHHHVNPMLPKVYELYELGGWCISRMELLSEAHITHVVGMYNVVKAVRSPVFGVMNMTRKRKCERIEYYLRKWFDLHWMGNYNRTHLADIVIWLAGKGSKVSIDCHGGNWMQRNMQLVLTDPIS